MSWTWEASVGTCLRQLQWNMITKEVSGSLKEEHFWLPGVPTGSWFAVSRITRHRRRTLHWGPTINYLNPPDSPVNCICSYSHFNFEESQAQTRWITSLKWHSQSGEDSRAVSLPGRPVVLCPFYMFEWNTSNFVSWQRSSGRKKKELGNKRVGLRLCQLPWCCIYMVMAAI